MFLTKGIRLKTLRGLKHITNMFKASQCLKCLKSNTFREKLYKLLNAVLFAVINNKLQTYLVFTKFLFYSSNIILFFLLLQCV